MDRAKMIERFRDGDAIQTGDAAKIWGVPKLTARERMKKMPDLVGTNTNSSGYGKPGKVDGRYVDEVWQVWDSEDSAMIERVVNAFFPV